MSVNPKKIAENIANDVASGVVKCIIESVCMAVPVVGPIVGAVASAGIDRVFENLRQDKPKKPYERIREICEQNLREEDQKHLTVISVITMQCVQSLDRFDYHDPEKLAHELSDQFLSKKTEDFFDDAESRQLYERYLPEILRQVIIEIQNKNQADENFQRQFKEFIVQYLTRHDEQLADHEKRITTMEETIEDKKKDPNFGRVKDKTEYYKSIWKNPLFLDKKLSLSQNLYQIPHYIESEQIETDTPKTNLPEYLQQILDGCDTPLNKMLVVLGQPGIGKSTLVTWMLNHCNFKERKVRVYRFTAFNKYIDWTADTESILAKFLVLMGFEDTQELEHSILILDGLDEINMGSNQVEFLNHLCQEWAWNIEEFSLIVTCRTNRIPRPEQLRCNSIELCPLAPKQIEEFAVAYYNEKHMSIEDLFDYKKIEESKLQDVLGIPIILYMTLSLGIKVEQNSNLADVYKKIFSLKRKDTSIYYREQYDSSGHPITKTEPDKIHEFSKRIAVRMWESDKDSVEKLIYQGIARDILNFDEKKGLTEAQLRNLLIGQYFIEGKKEDKEEESGYELWFVHRSIYEYFVAVSIFDVVQEMVKPGKSPKDLYQQLEQSIQNGERCDLAPFATIMGLQRLPEYPEIQGYLLSLFDGKPAAMPDWWRAFFDGFNEHGLSDATIGRRKGGPVGIQEELNRFYNLIWFVKEQLRLAGKHAPFKIWSTEDTPIFFRVQDSRKKDLSELRLDRIDFQNFYLKGVHLEQASLSNSLLINANLQDAHLQSACLQGANLNGAHLEDACFGEIYMRSVYQGNIYQGVMLITKDNPFYSYSAHLSNAYLKGAFLENTRFYGVNLTGLDLSHVDLSKADLRGAILPEGYIIDEETGHLLSRSDE